MMTIAKRRVTDVSDNEFSALWQLYLNSFPVTEQRSLAKAKELLKDEHLYLYSYVLNGEVVAGVWYWEYEDYLFVEFISVSQTLRNGGWGSKILKELMDVAKDKLVILEIDEMIDEISIRRHGFYKRLGFIMNDYKHITPAYHNPKESINLHILSYPNIVPQEMYDRFYENLVNNIILYCCPAKK